MIVETGNSYIFLNINLIEGDRWMRSVSMEMIFNIENIQEWIVSE